MISNLLVVVLVLCSLFTSSALRMARSNALFRSSLRMSETPVDVKKMNPREERRRILGSSNYNRKGFKSEKEGVAGMMVEEFTSPLIAEMRANGGVVKRGDVTVKLAEYYGFCWGVERAIAMAYEARAHYPDNTIHITNEIIHNPQVNDRLNEMDIKFMGKDQNSQKDFSVVKDGDVVILPAFGATIQEMQMLDERGVQIVDTTCPWVSKVWNAVDSHIRSGQTSVIHGKYAHEETIATASFCADYIVVKDLPEAQYLIDYIVNGGNKEEFLEKFKNAISVGFDPDVHLEKVGLANQTTMYKRETKEIGRMLEKAILTKFGPAELGQRYNEFDTICDATQERQDAVTELVEKKGLDFVLVVGGFDSSNTAHLKEIPEKFGVEAFHINRPECITEENKVSHRLDNGDIVVHENFLKKGPMTIGVTSGASTPDKAMEDALERIFMLHKLL
ncbi:4-hydroxy-3-methylbut-2-enyl diphosphate reductase [Ochromonadaceae sp. CCMP2298]|nr:4-hydroxy-3-methylbut-2-enyl diphosphate reductase [Ochromonadaceae sp. CCMP2298]